MKRTVPAFGNSVIRLRLLTAADLEMTMAWRNCDDVRVWFKNSQVLTPSQHRAWFEQYSIRDDDFVFVVEAGGVPVGQAAVYGIDDVAGIAEVGRFLVAPGEGGKGYTTAACSELLKFCAGTLKLASVFLEVKEDNQRAIRIYLRNNFREEKREAGMIRMSRDLSSDLALTAAGSTAEPAASTVRR